MKNKFLAFLSVRKYELLLVALLLHLFNGVFMADLVFYAQVIWPINMFILGICSVGIFSARGSFHKLTKNILTSLVVILPVALIFAKASVELMQLINIAHIAFYTFIFIEVLRYLLKPSYISSDIVLASICGYLLLVEIGIFTMQSMYYANPSAFKGIDATTNSTVFLDFVYFCSITLTSIGFGDITPSHHTTKLITAILGIAGQFYSVVLVGIMISKYTSAEINKQD